MTDRFVVGTGRCGSTLLSTMLDQHSATLGLNEVFTGLDWGRRFVDGDVPGAEVADILDTPNHVIDLVVGRGYDAEEVTYRFRDEDRYHRGDPIPWILTSTLPYLSDDPDALWDELRPWLAERGRMPIGEHYRALFEHLAARSNKTEWIERSGSSVQYVADLARIFPDARFVHLHRNGVEVALSMRNHPFFRLAVQLFYGVMPDGVDPADENAVVDAWLTGDPPISLYGQYWSDQLADGFETLGSLPHDQLLTVSFEEMLESPVETMIEIAEFFELPPDDRFAGRAAALVRNAPPSHLDELTPEQQVELINAVQPGRELLRDLGVTT
jgi:hypothetical protein